MRHFQFNSGALVVLEIAAGMNGGRLVGELSPHHRCHILKGVARTTASPTAILRCFLAPSFL
jgi:hypothetical protein